MNENRQLGVDKGTLKPALGRAYYNKLIILMITKTPPHARIGRKPKGKNLRVYADLESKNDRFS
jgi:hypothetical protein